MSRTKLSGVTPEEICRWVEHYLPLTMEISVIRFSAAKASFIKSEP
jgi:hypothetical protein